MVSFTGQSDATILEKVDGSTQTVAEEATPDLTFLARQARGELRRAGDLNRRRAKGQTLNDRERALLQKRDCGTLRIAANDATRKSGYGRIHHEDGSFEDLHCHQSSKVRTLFDNVVTAEMSDKQEPNTVEEPDIVVKAVMSDEEELNAVEEPNWG